MKNRNITDIEKSKWIKDIENFELFNWENFIFNNRTEQVNNHIVEAKLFFHLFLKRGVIECYLKLQPNLVKIKFK